MKMHSVGNEGVLLKLDDNISNSMYKINQLPQNWISVGKDLLRDADIIFNAHQTQINILISELKRKHFNFSYFYRESLESEIYNLLENNKDFFLPNFRSFYLLSSLALENMFKAIILAKNYKHLGFEKIPPYIKEHNLLKLSKKTPIIFSREEDEFLNKLSSLFISYARYPIGTKVDNSQDMDLGYDSHFDIVIKGLRNEYITDKNLFDSIIDKLAPNFSDILHDVEDYYTQIAAEDVTIQKY